MSLHGNFQTIPSWKIRIVYTYNELQKFPLICKLVVDSDIMGNCIPRQVPKRVHHSPNCNYEKIHNRVDQQRRTYEYRLHCFCGNFSNLNPQQICYSECCTPKKEYISYNKCQIWIDCHCGGSNQQGIPIANDV